MQQSQVDQAIDDLHFVIARLQSSAKRGSLADRAKYTEMVDIINAAVVAIHTASTTDDLTVSLERFTDN